MTKTKQIVFTSPLLVRQGRRHLWYEGPMLVKRHDKANAVCIHYLSQFVDMPESKCYQIEISKSRWGDDSGCLIWLRARVGGGFVWKEATRTQRRWRGFDSAADAFILRHFGPLTSKATRCYFRLIYDEQEAPRHDAEKTEPQ